VSAPSAASSNVGPPASWRRTFVSVTRGPRGDGAFVAACPFEDVDGFELTAGLAAAGAADAGAS
jgi:hypothetical protein